MLRSKLSRGACLVALALTMVAASGCKKKPPQTDPTDVEQVATLAVRGVRPSQGTTAEQTPITIQGEAFTQGAKVFIGDTPAENVEVRDSRTIAATVPKGMAPNSYVVVVRNPDGKEASLLKGFTVVEPTIGAPTCEVEEVYFEFDDSTLSEGSRSSLQAALDCLRTKNASRIRLEGHADERGSTDYNVALGQKRAESVKNYLVNLGFQGGNIATVSYGEERPANPASNEEAWAQNRRVEIVVVE